MDVHIQRDCYTVLRGSIISNSSDESESGRDVVSVREDSSGNPNQSTQDGRDVMTDSEKLDKLTVDMAMLLDMLGKFISMIEELRNSPMFAAMMPKPPGGIQRKKHA